MFFSKVLILFFSHALATHGFLCIWKTIAFMHISQKNFSSPDTENFRIFIFVSSFTEILPTANRYWYAAHWEPSKHKRSDVNMCIWQVIKKFSIKLQFTLYSIEINYLKRKFSGNVNCERRYQKDYVVKYLHRLENIKII